MTNSYLIEVIKALTPEEREEIVWFLKGPQVSRMGNAKELIRLYQIIIDAAPDFPYQRLQKKEVFIQIFSSVDIVPGKLEKLMAELKQLNEVS